MEIPMTEDQRNDDVTIIRYSKYPQGTKQRVKLENYILEKSTQLITLELTMRGEIESKLN